MKCALNELKIRAKRLFKKERLKPDEHDKQLKHYLQRVSVSLGFDSWQQASHVLSGRINILGNESFGAFFHMQACNALINRWFSSYQDARNELKVSTESYLSPYKQQFVVANTSYLTAIGIDDKSYDLLHRIEGDLIKGYGTPEWDSISLSIIQNR